MYLQERIEELGSGILNIKDKVYVTGFMSPERLKEYYFNKKQCFLSKGIYENEDLDFSRIKDNALFIILKNNKEIEKYQFSMIKKGTITYKDKSNNSTLSKVYKIRKCNFTDRFNYIDSDTSIIFNNYAELSDYFIKRFKSSLD